MKISPTITLALLTIFMAAPAQAQTAALYEVPLEERIDRSEVIVEGRVVDQESFWNSDRTLIFTASNVDVYRVFKGQVQGEQIRVITPGGRVNLTAQRVEPALHLTPGDVGVFFAERATVLAEPGKTDRTHSYQPYASVQGFARYDEMRGRASDVFTTYADIEEDLHRSVVARTGEPVVMKGYSVPKPVALRAAKSGMVPVIVSISPTTVTAGTNDVLTITGTGFEANDGGTNSRVFFANADDGGNTIIAAPAGLVSSWSDTQIQVRVPSRAGTGTVTVQTASSEQATSAATLTIEYNLLTLSYQGDAWRTSLINKSAGGYSLRMSTRTSDGGDNFATSDAVAPFERALLTWQQSTGLNIRNDGAEIDSSRISPNSENDIVTFADDLNVLPSGVLGRAFSGFTSCDGQTWVVQGIDIQFRRDGDGITWNYGPAPNSGNMADFESVALHELGHGHQLGHVIAPGNVMHYSITNGTDNRIPDAGSDVAGGNDAIDFTAGLNYPCGTRVWTGMTRLVGVGVEDEQVFGRDVLSDAYPNPASGRASFSVRVEDSRSVTVDVFDVLGRRVARVFEGILSPGVDHEFEFHAEQLPAGLYFYTASGPEFRSTRKLVMMD
jgi:hypothetical protein